MKKRWGFFAAALAVLLLAGCQCKHEYDQGVTTREATCKEEGICTYTCQKCKESYEEPIPRTDHIYNDRVTREPTYEREGERTYTCTICKDSFTEAIPALEKPVEVTVTAKNTRIDYFFEWILLDFRVENLENQEIRGLRGKVIVMDLFGKEIETIPCSFTETPIPAGEKVDFPERPMIVDSNSGADVQFFQTDFSELQFSFVLEQVVYPKPEPEAPSASDGQEEKGEVRVTVDNMTGYPADLFSDRHSSIRLILRIENDSGKELKAIEGTVTVWNMFGDELATYQCDLLTRKNFRSQDGRVLQLATITYYDMTSGDLEVLYSDFEELDFLYTIGTILYEDGSQEVLRQSGISV